MEKHVVGNRVRKSILKRELKSIYEVGSQKMCLMPTVNGCGGKTIYGPASKCNLNPNCWPIIDISINNFRPLWMRGEPKTAKNMEVLWHVRGLKPYIWKLLIQWLLIRFCSHRSASAIDEGYRRIYSPTMARTLLELTENKRGGIRAWGRAR